MHKGEGIHPNLQRTCVWILSEVQHDVPYLAGPDFPHHLRLIDLALNNTHQDYQNQDCIKCAYLTADLRLPTLGLSSGLLLGC